MSQSERKGRVVGKGLELRVASMLLTDLFMFFALIQRTKNQDWTRRTKTIEIPFLCSEIPERWGSLTFVRDDMRGNSLRSDTPFFLVACLRFVPSGPPAQVGLLMTLIAVFLVACLRFVYWREPSVSSGPPTQVSLPL